MSRGLAGLAHGWEGAAWTTLRLIRAGRQAFTDTFACELIDRLARGDGDRPGQLLGFGGCASVAVLAADVDAELIPLAERVLARWTATTCEPDEDDVFGGHPGALLAIAELADCRAVAVPDAFVERCHTRTLAALARLLATDDHLLGFAHGLAGVLLAAEVGAARLGRPRDAALIERAFDRLAETRIHAPSIGTVWAPTRASVDGITGAWCHGTAGIALALSTCRLVTGEAAYAELLAEVAPSLGSTPIFGPTFCCGRAGQVQVLIELHRQTGDPSWLHRARALAGRAVTMTLSPEFPDGFSQGSLGLAYADARLRDPLALPLPATGVGHITTSEITTIATAIRNAPW